MCQPFYPTLPHLTGPLPPALLVKKPVYYQWFQPNSALFYTNQTISGYITNASVLQEASSIKVRRGRDSNSRTRLSPITHLAGERLQPARPPLQVFLFCLFYGVEISK